jgi:hypothetical protein
VKTIKVIPGSASEGWGGTGQAARRPEAAGDSAGERGGRGFS